MSLENVQRVTNSQRVALGQTSASNDPHQWQHDGREQLIKGAELAAAGRTLGMSEEETLAAVSRQFRRQSRADDSVTPTDVLRQMTQAASTTTDYVGRAEIDGTGYLNESEAERAFGQDQGKFYEYGPNDRQYDEQERGKLRESLLDAQDSGDEGLERDIKRQLRLNPEDVPEMAPKSVLTNALSDLERSAQRQQGGIGGKIAQVFGGSGVDSETSTAMDALQRHLGNDRADDARVGRALVSGDNQRFNPEMREYNDNRAEAESQAIARDSYTVNGPGAMADESIGRIAEIRSLGKIGETAHVVRTANDAIKGQATRRHDGVYLDPVSGNPIAVQGPQLPSVLAGDRTPNNGSTSDNLNAPQTAQEWVVNMMPDNQDATGKFPQVDITLETSNFANKLRELEGMGLQGVSSNIRSVEELQRVVDHITRKSAEQGKTLYRRDPETGSNRPIAQPSTPEVMQLLRMSAPEQGRLANAMFQLDAARRSSVNQNPTGTYLSRTGGPTEDVTFNAPEPSAQGVSGPKIARVRPGTTIRTGTNIVSGKPVRQTVQSQLAGLESPDAQRPYIGQVEGEKPRVERYNRTGETEPAKIDAALRVQDEARARRDRKPVDEAALKSKQVKAKLVQERENRDSAKRAEQASTLISQLPPTARRSPIRRG